MKAARSTNVPDNSITLKQRIANKEFPKDKFAANRQSTAT